MHHLRDISQYITGYFKSQQEDTFCQGNLHQDKVFQSKNDRRRYYRGHMEISKKFKIIFKRLELGQLWPLQVGRF